MCVYIYIYLESSMTSIVARRKFPVIDQLYSHLQQFWSKLRRVLPEPIKTRWISLHDGESSSFLERIRFPRTRFSRTLVYFDPFSSRAKLDPISSQLEILLSLRVVRTSAVIKILYLANRMRKSRYTFGVSHLSL